MYEICFYCERKSQIVLNASIIGENRVHQRPLKPAVHLKNCGATAAAAPHPSEHPGSSEREEEIAGEPVAASQLLVVSTGSAEQVRGALSIALSAISSAISVAVILLWDV